MNGESERDSPLEKRMNIHEMMSVLLHRRENQGVPRLSALQVLEEASTAQEERLVLPLLGQQALPLSLRVDVEFVGGNEEFESFRGHKINVLLFASWADDYDKRVRGEVSGLRFIAGVERKDVEDGEG